MDLEDENLHEHANEALDNLSKTQNLNDTLSVNTYRSSNLFYPQFAKKESNLNKDDKDNKLELSSGTSNASSVWDSNIRGPSNSEYWRNESSAPSSNNDEEDISEVLNNLFALIQLDDHDKSSKRLKDNDSDEENSATNSILEAIWRRIDDSFEASDTWWTKYNVDKSRKWNYEERQEIETDCSDTNWWKSKPEHYLLRDDNKDEISNDRSSLTYDINQNMQSYQDDVCTRQNSSESNRFENPVSYISLSLQRILKLQTEEVSDEVISAAIDEIATTEEMISGDLSFDEGVLLLRVFDKICCSFFDKNRGKLIICIINGKFLEKIPQYVLLLAAQDPEDQNKNMFFWENPEQFWNNLLVFYENIFEFMPLTAGDSLSMSVEATVISINETEKYQDIKLSTNLKIKLEKFQETLTGDENQSNPSGEIEDPLNSFRLLNVYPTVKEITTNEVPFIRPIIKNGAYQSIEHYLDVHFRLLKEDFTATLRNGICTYLQKEETQQFDVRIYENVQFISPHIARDRVATLLQYTTKIDNRGIEEGFKRFIYGTLLCFTSNNFEEVSFGIVVDNNIQLLQSGLIIVDIREGYVDFNKNYTMIECTVFFEPYYQVLMALKNLNEDNFPFKDYIIDVMPKTKPPKYIKQTTDAYFLEEGYKIKILSPETWPKPEQVGLNESQFKAFQSALTQEFCIIQGPPGTGKTYTTLRIVEFLVRNKISLDYIGPIFVICFTNHALDQFLEALLPFTERLLRVGGQSKSPVMQKYNLNHYREIIRTIVQRAIILKRHENLVLIHPDEEKYDFSDYMDHYYIKNSAGKHYYDYKKKLEGYQQLLTDVLSCNGIIHFQNLVRHGVFDRFSWFGRRSTKRIIEWMMEDTIQIGIEEIGEAREDATFYFQPNDIFHERSVIDDLLEKIYELSTDSSFLITMNDYTNLINSYEFKIMNLDVNNELDAKIYLEYKARIKLAFEQMCYLSWRLGQCKSLKETEGTLPDMSIPPEQMTPDDRWALYRHWLHLLRLTLCEEISEMDADLRGSYQAYQEVAQIRDIYIMQKMQVIGMTTTGAARHKDILETLKCPIVIAEEAAEVLEAHIVVSLTEHCQHLILIGDHQQLRPTTAQHNLATNYNLEISLFERMIQNGIHCQQLNVQHRMRPEIAKLIVPAIYPKLNNSLTVENFPPIRGLAKNMFFIDHSVNEDHIYNSTSYKNVYEAKYLIGLASYLIKQGYTQEEITILATYKEQMDFLLKEKCVREELNGVRITVVDNFQGEENKIILLSLVRSNEEDRIGFLKTENRVCVALSRAKEGFFIIGNMHNLEESSTIWPKIKKALVEQDAIGETLTLQCQIHGTKTTIRTWEDFAAVSEGGCNQPCNTKLRCNHICMLPCHLIDAQHENYVCKEKCIRTCPRGHPCVDKVCYVKCTPCNVLVKTKLSCGHIQRVPCFAKPEKYVCNEKIETIFSCGHPGIKLCHENPKNIDCLYPCEKLLNCGHTYIFACRVKNGLKELLHKCNQPCMKYKKNCSTHEHMCPLKCYEKCPPCTDIIQKRRSTCTHKVRVPCNKMIDNTPCREKCRKMLSCGHYCPKLCFEECGNCPVMVTKIIEPCGHSIKTECRNEVNRSMCINHCSQLLKCGHPCKNKCNEPCNEQCKEFVTYRDLTTEDMITNFCYQLKIMESEHDSIDCNSNIS